MALHKFYYYYKTVSSVIPTPWSPLTTPFGKSKEHTWREEKGKWRKKEEEREGKDRYPIKLEEERNGRTETRNRGGTKLSEMRLVSSLRHPRNGRGSVLRRQFWVSFKLDAPRRTSGVSDPSSFGLLLRVPLSISQLERRDWRERETDAKESQTHAVYSQHLFLHSALTCCFYYLFTCYG